jgi:AraC-like DNA-binding protein
MLPSRHRDRTRIMRSADPQPQPTESALRVGDMLGRAGVEFDSPADLSDDQTLMCGAFLNHELRPGLTLHLSDAVEQHPFAVTSMLGEGLNCVFFLDGAVDLHIGSRALSFRHEGHAPLTGAAFICREPERFHRVSRGRQRLRHLVISADLPWLSEEALAAAGLSAGERRLGDDLVDHRWLLPPRMLGLIAEVFAPAPPLPTLRGLYLESRAVEIVAETIAAISAVPAGGSAGLNRRELAQLARARAFVAEDPLAATSVAAIARAAGTSPGNLQRLFRLAEGMSVFDHVRKERLERAHAALREGRATVQQAAAMAGYSSAANFATGFRRRYGHAPGELLPRR